MRRGTIARLEYELRGLRGARIKAKNHDARVAMLESDIEALTERKRYVVPALSYPLGEGQIGRLPRAAAHVLAVRGAQEMVVEATFPVRVAEMRKGRLVAVKTHKTVQLVIRGVDTKDARPAMDVPLSQVFEIKPAEAGPLGGKPYVAEPFDMRTIEGRLLDRN